MKHYSEQRQRSEDSISDDYDFQDIFALGRFLEGVRDLRRNSRDFSHLAFIHAICMASIAIFVAFVIVPGNLITFGAWGAIQVDIFVFIGLSAFAFLVFRPYHSLWRYTSLSDLILILTVSTIVTLAYVIVDNTMGTFLVAEWGTYLNAWLLMVMLMSGPRIATRLAAVPNVRIFRGKQPDPIKLLLIGAGDGTELFIRALNRDSSAQFRIVGIVDEMSFNLCRRIHGVEVLGALIDLETIVRRLDLKDKRPKRLVITEEQLFPVGLQSMLDEADTLGLTLCRIPRVTELRADIDR